MVVVAELVLGGVMLLGGVGRARANPLNDCRWPIRAPLSNSPRPADPTQPYSETSRAPGAHNGARRRSQNAAPFHASARRPGRIPGRSVHS
jgi:hypothetical protein